jgi:hypothetical protein
MLFVSQRSPRRRPTSLDSIGAIRHALCAAIMRRSSILLIFWIAILTAPAAVTWFDGLPFNSLPEALALAALLPLVLSAAHRRLVDRAVAKSTWIAAALVGATLFAASLKATAAAARPAGFSACYETTLTPPPAGKCERSFDNPFFRFDATRIDRVIDFGPADWNLAFVNSLRFNLYPWVQGLRRADRLPFKVAWRGVIESGQRDAMVAYVGEGTIGIDAKPIDLPPSYDRERTVPFTLTPGRHVVRIYYTFDDGSLTRVRQPLGPYATFRLTATAADGTVQWPLESGRPPMWLRATAVGLDALLLGGSIALAAWFAFLLRFQLRSIAIVGCTFAAAWLGVRAFGWPAQAGATLVACSLVAAVLRRNRSTTLLLAYIVLLLAGTWAAFGRYPSLGAVVFRNRGEDWLTYESMARTILETWSLQGGEPVFYIQPLFRYLRFAERLLLGDGDPLIDLFGWTALTWSILWATSTISPGRAAGRLRTGLFATASALTLALAGSALVVEMIRLSLSEHATWILTAAAFALLGSRSRPRWVAGGAFLGAAVITRPNQAPALAAIAAAFLVPALWRRARPAMLAAAAFFGICLLPLAHNLYYGGQPVIFTTTADSPQTLGMPVGRLARSATDATARAELTRAVRGLMFLPPWRSSFGKDEVRFVLYALLAVWAAGLCLAVRRSVPARVRVLAVVPALYLGVHVFYAVGNYYPRHILAAYFAMGLVTMTIAAQRRATHPSDVGHHDRSAQSFPTMAERLPLSG